MQQKCCENGLAVLQHCSGQEGGGKVCTWREIAPIAWLGAEFYAPERGNFPPLPAGGVYFASKKSINKYINR